MFKFYRCRLFEVLAQVNSLSACLLDVPCRVVVFAVTINSQLTYYTTTLHGRRCEMGSTRNMITLCSRLLRLSLHMLCKHSWEFATICSRILKVPDCQVQ